MFHKSQNCSYLSPPPPPILVNDFPILFVAQTLVTLGNSKHALAIGFSYLLFSPFEMLYGCILIFLFISFSFLFS
jgi:hypothetical protein